MAPNATNFLILFLQSKKKDQACDLLGLSWFFLIDGIILLSYPE